MAAQTGSDSAWPSVLVRKGGTLHCRKVVKSEWSDSSGFSFSFKSTYLLLLAWKNSLQQEFKLEWPYLDQDPDPDPLHV